MDVGILRIDCGDALKCIPGFRELAHFIEYQSEVEDGGNEARHLTLNLSVFRGRAREIALSLCFYARQETRTKIRRECLLGIHAPENETYCKRELRKNGYFPFAKSSTILLTHHD